MNIFVLNECPVISAEQMLDKHVVKMPTESMQMISTCLDHLGFESPYKPVMLNHPCTIWARESKDNMRWLIRHTNALCKEYTKRYNKRHKVEDTLEEYMDRIVLMIDSIESKELTPFAIAISPNMNCRKLDNFDEMTAIEKYRNYYIEDKWWFAEWKTQEPEWWPHNHYNIKMKELTIRRNKNVMDRKV